MTCSRRLLSTLVAALFAWSFELAAQQVLTPPPFPAIAGPELWIDGPDAVQPGLQRDLSAVAVDDTGRRIHVWGASGGGLDNREVFLRLFDSTGGPLGDPVMVNTTTIGLQDNPRMAVAGDGSFLVVFDSREETPPSEDALAPAGAGEGVLRRFVRSQAYDAGGNPVGTEQLLSTLHTGSSSPTSVDVAALRTPDGAAGGYAVVWQSASSVGSDSNASIQGCMVGATGVPAGQFQVNSDDAPDQTWPAVTELQDGGFLATWTKETPDQVWGRRFNAAGVPVGADFQISTAFDALKVEKDAAIGWQGGVAVVWSDSEDDGGANGREIRMRLYDSELNPLGPDFRVNSLTTDQQESPRVADYGPEGFLVVWESAVASGADLGDSIEARLVTGVDQFSGPQVQYNTWDDDRAQQFPSTHGWYGRIATDWNSPTWDGDPMPANPNADFIIGRDIEHCLFCADFDWFDPGGAGSLWRWTAVVGGD